MSIKVTIVENTLDPLTWKKYDVEALLPFLKSYFGKLPETARIFQGSIAKENDVTPSADDKDSIDRLAALQGPFFVYVYPGNPAVALAVVSVLISVASVILAPSYKAPLSVQRNQDAPSSNNELSDRSNKARINGRIEDIYGRVRSVPTLIGAPYKVFENNVEIEYALMCIGRGYFDVEDIRDGDTKCVNIPGTSIMVYEPYTSPNSGHTPQLTVGQLRTVPILEARRSNSVNGQVLRPPNITTFFGSQDVRFRSPNMIELVPGSSKDFTKYFVAGDIVNLTGAVITADEVLTETMPCRATFVNLREKYGFHNISEYEYDTAGGSLLFLLNDSYIGPVSGDPYGLFVPGAVITLNQTKGDSRYPGVDLSGEYTVLSTATSELTPGQASLGVSQFFIVKLTSPEVETPDWSSLGSGSYDYTNEAGKFEFEVAHAGSNVDYDLNLNGNGYELVSVTKELLVLNNPSAVNAEWDDIETEANGVTPFLSSRIDSTGEGRYVGPFTITEAQTEQLLCNFVASNGLYIDDGTEQIAIAVTIEIEVTPVDEADEPIGNPETFSIELLGSAELKETVAVTLKARISSFQGRCSVRARRLTEHDDSSVGTVVDEVRWRDLYGSNFTELVDFGYVTTIQSITYATASALAVKERKLNMLVTRKLPLRVGDTDLFTDDDLQPTLNAADIFVAICRDKYIGNRTIAELDINNIYNTVAEIEAYFGTSAAIEFSHTFDSDNLSFQETANIVAEAIHSVAYRRGNIIRLSFEKRTDDSTLLFNHRNKIPKSETRNFRFGKEGDFDGIQYVYTDPINDAAATIFLPLNYTAVNPKKIQSVGIRNRLQAYFHAWRKWNKLNYQIEATEFDATQESNLVLRNDRILVADSTAPYTQDGEVIAVDALELTLSKNIDFSLHPAYSIFLQLSDVTVENIIVTEGSAPNKVVLNEPPSISLNTNEDSYAKTAFIIVGSTEKQQTAFLVNERETKDKMVSTVKAINYDDRYYANDPDFTNGVVGAGGYGSSGGFTPDNSNSPYDGVCPAYGSLFVAGWDTEHTGKGFLADPLYNPPAPIFGMLVNDNVTRGQYQISEATISVESPYQLTLKFVGVNFDPPEFTNLFVNQSPVSLSSVAVLPPVSVDSFAGEIIYIHTLVFDLETPFPLTTDLQFGISTTICVEDSDEEEPQEIAFDLQDLEITATGGSASSTEFGPKGMINIYLFFYEGGGIYRYLVSAGDTGGFASPPDSFEVNGETTETPDNWQSAYNTMVVPEGDVETYSMKIDYESTTDGAHEGSWNGLLVIGVLQAIRLSTNELYTFNVQIRRDSDSEIVEDATFTIQFGD